MPPPAPIRRAIYASNGSTAARGPCPQPTSSIPTCRRRQPSPAPTAPARSRFSHQTKSIASSLKSTTADKSPSPVIRGGYGRGKAGEGTGGGKPQAEPRRFQIGNKPTLVLRLPPPDLSRVTGEVKKGGPCVV